MTNKVVLFDSQLSTAQLPEWALKFKANVELPCSTKKQLDDEATEIPFNNDTDISIRNEIFDGNFYSHYRENKKEEKKTLFKRDSWVGVVFGATVFAGVLLLALGASSPVGWIVLVAGVVGVGLLIGAQRKSSREDRLKIFAFILAGMTIVPLVGLAIVAVKNFNK